MAHADYDRTVPQREQSLSIYIAMIGNGQDREGAKGSSICPIAPLLMLARIRPVEQINIFSKKRKTISPFASLKEVGRAVLFLSTLPSASIRFTRKKPLDFEDGYSAPSRSGS